MTVEARQAAIEALYEADQRELKEAAEGLSARAARMVTGVLEHQTDLDRLIDAASDHWRINRMPVVDRAILRLGVYELLYELDTPAPVVVSEAVRLAKIFGSEKSGAFVNGILAALVTRLRSSAPPVASNSPLAAASDSPLAEAGGVPERSEGEGAP
ncbi:transcription antitermination factor NusB [soil metagenome]